MVNRAYSLIQIKSLDEEQRVIRGIATTPTPDRGDDIVEPFGVKFRNPLPFILHHDRKSPVGDVYFDPPTKAGIAFTAHLPKVVEPGLVRDRVDEAWHSAKYGLLKGVSIGYVPLKTDRRKSGGVHLKEIEVVELSMVAVPMNAETTILAIKSLDAAHLAAFGTGSRIAPGSHPGVSGMRKDSAMTISEQITTAKTELQHKSARLEELMRQDDTDGGLSEAEASERDAITEGVKSLVKQVDRLGALEAAQAAQASSLAFTPNTETKTVRANPRIEVVKPDLPKGTLFTRYAMAVAAGKGSVSDTLAYSKRWDSQTPEVTAYIKAVAGSTIDESPGWGSQLVYAQNLASEFVALVRPMTVLGRLTGTRSTPFNVRIVVQSGGSTVNWVGEKAAKPVTELEFTTITLGYDKIAGIVVVTDELVRLSSPSAEATVRQDLTEQIAQFMDSQFLDPAVAAGANNPASVTNGVASPAASGTDADALYVDLNTALATFDNADLGTESVHIVMTPALARGISTLRNALGQAEFPTMNPSGGTLLGYPVIVSSSVPSGTIVLIKANEILVADDGRVTLDASNQATLDMAGGDTPAFSLWQKNCTGIRAERWITWAKRRTASVAVIDTASYGPSVGSP